MINHNSIKDNTTAAATTDGIMQVPYPTTSPIPDGVSQQQIDDFYEWNKTQRAEPKHKEKLTRKDFKTILIKGINKHYYSFRSSTLSLEICLEPCFNGFDIAVYTNTFDVSTITKEDPELKEKKVCTDMEVSDEMFKKEIIGETQERSQETWDKALRIANDVWRRYRNTKKLKNWGMIEDKLGASQFGASASVFSGYLDVTGTTADPKLTTRYNASTT